MTFDFDDDINDFIFLNEEYININKNDENKYTSIFTTVNNNSLLTFNFHNIKKPFEFIFKNLTIKELIV